jgi:hypothetical protein
MKLIEAATYTDPKQVKWLAPVGAIVDGASIPRFAWSIIGGPYEGRYRNASVFHDVACDAKDRPWQDVHEMFFNAMMASGVDTIKAKVMYAAVYHFGPRWSLPGQPTEERRLQERDFERLQAEIERREKEQPSILAKRKGGKKKSGGRDTTTVVGPMSLREIERYEPTR